MERAGLTEVLVTGMEIRWIKVRDNPMATPANALPRVAWVAPRITKTNTAVSTTSIVTAPPNPNPPGECSANPFDANPSARAVSSHPWGPERPMRNNTVEAAAPPTTWAIRYAGTSAQGMRPALATPTVTAGLKCPPEMGPHAYTPTNTVNPKASATPRNPTPREVPLGLVPKLAANRAVPTPPNTSRNVPKNSATILVCNVGELLVDSSTVAASVTVNTLQRT